MRWSMLLVCLAAIAATGCGEDTGSEAGVIAIITLQGQPVDVGTINFFSQPPIPECFRGSFIQDAASMNSQRHKDCRISAQVKSAAPADRCPLKLVRLIVSAWNTSSPPS